MEIFRLRSISDPSLTSPPRPSSTDYEHSSTRMAHVYQPGQGPALHRDSKGRKSLAREGNKLLRSGIISDCTAPAQKRTFDLKKAETSLKLPGSGANSILCLGTCGVQQSYRSFHNIRRSFSFLSFHYQDQQVLGGKKSVEHYLKIAQYLLNHSSLSQKEVILLR